MFFADAGIRCHTHEVGQQTPCCHKNVAKRFAIYDETADVNIYLLDQTLRVKDAEESVQEEVLELS